MKKINFYICLLSICIILSCNMYQNKSTNQNKIVKDTLIKQGINTQSSLSLEALQGIWAENKEENAIFYIKYDTLYYTENQDNPILIKLHGDTLLMMGDVPVHCKILKLTNDSLWYIDEFNNTPTKLYKR
jgi:hypothetical protein